MTCAHVSYNVDDIVGASFENQMLSKRLKIKWGDVEGWHASGSADVTPLSPSFPPKRKIELWR